MYRIYTTVLIVLSCIVIGFFYVSTTRNIEKIYARDTEEVIYSIKQQYLKETINNQIARIDQLRDSEIRKYQESSVVTDTILAQLSNFDFPEYFSIHFAQKIESKLWDACLWDLETGEVEFDPSGLLQGTLDPEIELAVISDSYAVYTLENYQGYGAFYGVRKATVDNSVKRAIAEEIRGSSFQEDSYIWVNEVVDYAGGDRYAIRRIHPNLWYTEGTYLSTSMTDSVGNFPYLEELEGIKKDGELFFTYFFERKNSDEISEKLSYSKLYKDYDWIVSMGIHLDDLNEYIAIANDDSTGYTGRVLPIFLVVLVALVVFSYVSLVILERWRTSRIREMLETHAYHDALTGIPNRRRGTNDLTKEFKLFKKNPGHSPAIIFFDLDGFKQVNDSYGHAVGDRALQFVVEAVASLIRSSDRLYRWGGDEFVLVCPGIEVESIEKFSQAILDGVNVLFSQDTCPCKQLTISMGVTYFHLDDSTYRQAFERADLALYAAKRAGKNRVEMQL